MRRLLRSGRIVWDATRTVAEAIVRAWVAHGHESAKNRPAKAYSAGSTGQPTQSQRRATGARDGRCTMQTPRYAESAGETLFPAEFEPVERNLSRKGPGVTEKSGLVPCQNVSEYDSIMCRLPLSVGDRFFSTKNVCAARERTGSLQLQYRAHNKGKRKEYES